MSTVAEGIVEALAAQGVRGVTRWREVTLIETTAGATRSVASTMAVRRDAVRSGRDAAGVACCVAPACEIRSSS